MSEDFSSLSYKELQAACRRRGLRCTGRAEALVTRLKDHDGASVVDAELRTVQMAPNAVFQRLLKECLYSDVKFVVGPGEVVLQAHKAVLAAHSCVLGAMLQGSFQEAEHSVIRLPEHEPCIVEAFLALGYGGEVKLALPKLLALAELCHLYQTPEMMTAVAQAVVKALDTSSALALFGFGGTYNPVIQQKALGYIRAHPEEVRLQCCHQRCHTLFG